MAKNKPFYERGLYFSCTQCSDCCRHESGYVYLSENDVSSLAKKHEMTGAQFIIKFCRWVPYFNNSQRLSLNEKPNYDCIFWDKGCKVYNNRPLQCRAFPFWPTILNQKDAWLRTAVTCPGVNSGRFFEKTEIENILDSQAADMILTREAL